MRLLVITHSFGANGAAVMLRSLLLHLRRSFGTRIDALHRGNEALCEELRDAGVRFVRRADLVDYDLALVNTILDGGWVSQIGNVLPTVLWIHEGDMVLWNSTVKPAEFATPFRLARRVVVQSAWQARSVYAPFLAGLPPHRVAIIPNGLPPLPPVNDPVPRSPNRTRIAFVGTIYQRKRPADLVAAVEALDRPDIEVVFIGPTDHMGEIGDDARATIAARPDRYRLLGQQDRAGVAAWLGASDIHCLPSGNESQPISTLEAASCGVPSVLTALPAYEGIWTHGLDALLGPVGQVDVLAWNLRALIEDSALRARLGAAATKVAQRHSIEAFHARFSAMLVEAVAES